MSAFAGLPDQPYAARLLDAALEQPAHAYLLSGPAGSGKHRYADAEILHRSDQAAPFRGRVFDQKDARA